MIDKDFRDATGAALIEWDSAFVRELKLLNEIAFEKFQQGAWSAHDLFALNNGTAPLGLQVGDGLIGEYFSRVKTGDNVFIGKGVNIVAHGGVEIGNNVTIGNNVQLITVFHPMHPSQRLPIKTSPIIIEDGASIGDNALIISSRKDGRPLVIGKDSHILGGAVVIHDAAQGYYGGRPAYQIDTTEKMLQIFSHAAKRAEPGPPFENIAAARARLGANTSLVMPLYCTGEGRVTSDGFYGLNCGSRLSLQGDMHVGRDTLMAHSVGITVEEGAKLNIGKNVWVGAGVEITVAKGETLDIGAGSIIAAGAVVTKSVPENVVITGHNVAKKEITLDDFDHGISARWMDITNYIPKMLPVINAHREELGAFATSPHVMAQKIANVLSAQDKIIPGNDQIFSKNAALGGFNPG